PARQLPVGAALRAEAGSECVARVNGDGLAWFVKTLLERRSMVIVGSFNPTAMVEALVLSVPGPLRTELSFGAGLRFSLGRSFVLNVGDGDLRHLGRTVQGHGVTLFAPGTRPAPKLQDVGPWLQMARRRSEGGCWKQLHELTGRDYGDCTPDRLNRYGHLANLTDGLDEFETGAVIELLDDHLAAVPDDELEAELTITLVRNSLHRLADLLSTAVLEELVRYGMTVIRLWRRSTRTTTLLSPLMGDMLKRLTRQSLPVAVEHATQVIGYALQPEANTEPVRRAVDDLLDHLSEWVNDAPAEEVEALPELLEAWPMAPELDDRLSQLIESIEGRLEPA
ncbi:MAG: hypothetical protein GY778_00065, partial [bacterium]|nr:hypothetical protein [bacterium]